MRENPQYRPLMMVAGVVAAVVILFSQSFFYQAQSNLEKIKSEQSPDQDAKPTFVSAPSDAVVNSSVEKVNEQVPSLLEELFTTDEEAKAVSIVPTLFASFFSTLFRASISPNAP
jgi:hypothetical protein